MPAIDKIITPKRWPFLALLISTSMLLGAYAFEHIGGYDPCIMCYWQRHAHKGVIAVSLAVIIQQHFFPNVTLRRFLLWGMTIAFIVSFGYGFGHVGVEHGWWDGPKACLVAPMGEFNASDLLGSLSKPIEAPACADVVWSFLGLSMAGWNALVSAVAALISIRVATRKAI